MKSIPEDSRSAVGVKLEKLITYLGFLASSAGMMSSKVTSWMLHDTPITEQTSWASSRSHPTSCPLAFVYSFGAYDASVAITNGSIFLTAAGISLAMLDWVAGWGLVRIGLVLPQALITITGRARAAKAARRARLRWAGRGRACIWSGIVRR